jgi:hypothetical protein
MLSEIALRDWVTLRLASDAIAPLASPVANGFTPRSGQPHSAHTQAEARCRLSHMETAMKTTLVLLVAILLPSLAWADGTSDPSTDVDGSVETASQPTAPPEDTVASRIRALPEKGGKDSWDTAVRYILIRAFDSNTNNKINTAAEIAAISCDDWKAMDDGVRESWEKGIRVIYGFAPGYKWVGDAIGISKNMRRKADAALVACELE